MTVRDDRGAGDGITECFGALCSSVSGGAPFPSHFTDMRSYDVDEGATPLTALLDFSGAFKNNQVRRLYK